MRGRRLWGRGSGICKVAGRGPRGGCGARACAWRVEGAKARSGGAGDGRYRTLARGSSRSPLSACRGDPAGERLPGEPGG
jgi:hypothetical protein